MDQAPSQGATEGPAPGLGGPFWRALARLAGVKLYQMLVNGSIRSMAADWPAEAGSVATLDENAYMTRYALAQGWIELAPPGAVDNTTPPRVLMGQPGLHTAVSN